MSSSETNPTGVSALGKVKVTIIPAQAGAIPTTTELFAGVNFSYYVPGSEFPIDATQNTGQDIRLASTQVYDVLGQKSYQIADISYIFDPQTPGSGTPAAVFVDGYTGFLVIRYGLSPSTDWAVAQKVDSYPVTLGARTKSKTSADEFGKFTYTQKVVVSGAASLDVAIAS